MTMKLEMQGLSEFRAALRRLPEELADEANAIVIAHGEDAARRIKNAYPQGATGNLKRGVTTERNTSKFGASAIVRSRAKHSHLFERGTKGPRKNRHGANRGVMPRAPEGNRMIPIVIRVRRNMVKALIGLVRRAGFEVADV